MCTLLLVNITIQARVFTVVGQLAVTHCDVKKVFIIVTEHVCNADYNELQDKNGSYKLLFQSKYMQNNYISFEDNIKAINI